MTNILYITSHFVTLPLAFIFLFLFNEKRKQSLFWGLFFISLSSLLNIILYINIDFEKNIDPIITDIIISFIFLYILIKMSDIKTNFSSYNYLRNVILFGLGFYFFIEHIPVLRGVITLIVAIISAGIANIMGAACSISGIEYWNYSLLWQYKLNIIGGTITEVSVPVIPGDISIVLGCTGVREILLFYSFIMFTNADKSLKKKTFLITSSLVFIANILRNTIVIYYTGFRNLPFELTHHIIGTILIFIVLLFGVIFTLFKIPEINKHIENIFKTKKISGYES